MSLHLTPQELGTTNIVTHTIDMDDQPPIQQHPRRTPFALRGQVTTKVQDMLNNHVIQHSNSPWVSLIVLVEKRDGSFRFCVHYCRQNSVTKMDVFPLPRIDDTLDLLSRSKYFTTLEVTGKYRWMMPPERNQPSPLTQDSVSSLLCHSGFATYWRLQRLMETVLADLVRDYCVVYIDDILIVGETLSGEGISTDPRKTTAIN